MGLSIYANGIKRTFECSYIGFLNLRENIAKALDTDFYAIYSQRFMAVMQPKEWEKHLNNVLSHKEETGEIKDSDDVLDFLFESDCNGKVSYKTCRKIYDLIKDIDFGNRIFTYQAYSDGKDYEYFKKFLKDCYSKRASMRWE